MSEYMLQASCASYSNGGGILYIPHHPITCNGPLAYDEDGTFSCEHAKVPPDDVRTRTAVTHSIAVLLIEMASQL